MAQNQNTTAGTVTTDNSKYLNVNSPFYSITATDGSSETPCIHYSENNYLILNTSGTWEKVTAEQIRQYYGEIHSLNIGMHTHTIKGTFK